MVCMVVKYLKKFFFSFIWLGVLLFVIDIVSKHIALNAFGGWELFTAEPNPAPSVSFLPGFMSFTITFNTGAAWGIFGNLEDTARRIILIGISLVMSVAFIVFYIVKFKKLNNWYKAFLMCLAAGALSAEAILPGLFHSHTNGIFCAGIRGDPVLELCR